MIEQSLLMKLALPGQADHNTSRLRQECETYRQLFEAQSAGIQQYLRAQAANIAEAICQGFKHIQFNLPDQLVYPGGRDGKEEPVTLPAKHRQQSVHHLAERMSHSGIVEALCHRLDELESAVNQGVVIGACLLRYSIAFHLIYQTLPAGKTVVYATPQDEDIPNQPVETAQISARTFQNTEQIGEANNSPESLAINAPYVAAARCFYMPQWVAFDEHRQLLVNTVKEAEAIIASMQKYMDVLQTAIEIAPYMIADEVCQQKRYGMLGQLVNQGRLLAWYQLQEIIRVIQTRVAENNLNRGLSLNVPYFNDQTLRLELSSFEVIPKGRVMFVPAFVVLAVRVHGAKVAQDTRLSLSTRRNLLVELGTLEKKFMRE
jgi:hypothetical protein